MKFLIITHVPHILEKNKYYAYGPYVNEMNIWVKYCTDIIIVAPISHDNITAIDIAYQHNNIQFIATKNFNLLTFYSILRTIIAIPTNVWKILNAITISDHIHIRCPGNFGLLACIVQILFPNKIKTAKYAGNWDPGAKNPLTYKIQKWILSNTFLTRNMQVIVYGEWENQSKNIKPFFTATYKESEKVAVEIKKLDKQINVLFVGMLTTGKNPMYAIQIIEKLKLSFKNINLTFFGEGIERKNLENYIKTNNLETYVTLKGNQNLETLKNAYVKTHFLILPSASEGWPKAVAEAMFWGCLPIATPVSCVANMLDNDNRGVLINMDIDKDVQKIENLLNNEYDYQEKVLNATNWSRKFTLDYFEQEIKLLLQT